jgi:hypothetical protein
LVADGELGGQVALFTIHDADANGALRDTEH